MQCAGEQVQRGEQAGHALAAMPGVAIDVVAVARQALGALALDLTAVASGPCDGGHVVGRDL